MGSRDFSKIWIFQVFQGYFWSFKFSKFLLLFFITARWMHTVVHVSEPDWFQEFRQTRILVGHLLNSSRLWGAVSSFVRESFFRGGPFWAPRLTLLLQMVLGLVVTFELVYQRLHDARVWGFRANFWSPPKKSSWGGLAFRGGWALPVVVLPQGMHARLAFGPQRCSRGFKPRCFLFYAYFRVVLVSRWGRALRI